MSSEWPFADSPDFSEAGADVPESDTAELLTTVEKTLRSYVRFSSDAQVTAVALWVLHTYAIEAAETTPYLAISSAEKRSGKTRLQEVLQLLAANAVLAVSITTPALFRMIGQQRVTLLFDEVDAVFHAKGDDAKEDLRGVLNAGYRRGAVVYRTVGQGTRMRAEPFPVFCAKALSGIGRLPDTVADRSIPIRLQRRAQSEPPVARFREKHARAETKTLSEWLTSWGKIHVEQLTDAQPELPEALDDRAQDYWEPLLAIAELAGDDWPQRARQAAVILHADAMSEESAGVLLLAHIRDEFSSLAAGKVETDRIATDALLALLVNRDDGPWAGWWGKEIENGQIKGPAARLARLLRPYRIEPQKFGIPGTEATIRGYRRKDFADAWKRYLPQDRQ